MTITIFEFWGSFLSIIGAILVSYSTSKNIKPIFYSSFFYFSSNLLMIIFFFFTGKIPILMQMGIFLFLSYLTAIKYAPNPLKIKKILNSILFFYVLIFLFIIIKYNVNIDYSINVIDSIASLLAAIGSFITLKAKDDAKLRSKTYIFYIVADILFMYISYINHYNYFFFQSLFYVVTSIIAYKRTLYN